MHDVHVHLTLHPSALKSLVICLSSNPGLFTMYMYSCAHTCTYICVMLLLLTMIIIVLSGNAFHRCRAAKIDSFTTTLRDLHKEFQWPFPTVSSNDTSRTSTGESACICVAPCLFMNTVMFARTVCTNC